MSSLMALYVYHELVTCPVECVQPPFSIKGIKSCDRVSMRKKRLYESVQGNVARIFWICDDLEPRRRISSEIFANFAVKGAHAWSAHWIDNQLRQTLDESLHKAGRKRSDLDLNIWAFVAIDEDRKRAIDDARGTVAFYASMTQYEKYFAAHGFGAQARAAFEAAQRNDTEAMIKAIPDEMVTTFAIAGTLREVRERVCGELLILGKSVIRL